MNHLMIDLVLIFGASCVFLALFFAASSLYMKYRLKKIYEFLYNQSEIKVEMQHIIQAQRKFWVWPIKRVFK